MTARARWLAVLGLALVPACGRDTGGGAGAGGGGTGGGGGTLVYARGKDSVGLDPARETDGESALVFCNVFDTLVRFKYGSADVEPALAASWDAPPDGLSMTFHLRPGVRFHDGTPCDAAAVALNFERQRDKANPYHFMDYANWGAAFGYVSKTTAVDPKTVRFDFSETAPPFFRSLLAMFAASIVSPAALRQGQDFVARHPIGTGAFRFVSWEREEITLEANPDWWDGRPKIDRLVFIVVPEVRTALLRLETGQVQGIDNVAPRDVERVRKDARFALHQTPGMNVCYLTMNNDKAPFTDRRVRQAVALAINKARIIDAAYEGQAIPATTLVPGTIDGHASFPDRVRDVAAAKALLEAAGATGKRVALSFPSNPRPYMPNPNNVAMQVLGDLKEIGLDVELKKEEWNPYLDRLQNGEHEMGLIGWSADVADADNFLYVLLDKTATEKGSASNNSFYRSDAFHEKVAKARISQDPAERRRLYEDAQRIAFEDAPLVPLVHTPMTKATSSKVKGFVLDPVSSPRFAWVSLDR